MNKKANQVISWLAFSLYTNSMKWQDKIYTTICEAKDEDRHTTIRSNINKIKTMEDGPEREALKRQTLNLITGGRRSGRGAIETAPKRARDLRDTSR